jgi:NAD(P)-dependent dehydrogenase (short-subunit alcohol dehydrogenase family)
MSVSNVLVIGASRGIGLQIVAEYVRSLLVSSFE